VDVSFYRDDIEIRQPADVGQYGAAVDVAGKIVVLVDDVLYTGRTVRAAIEALATSGAPGRCSWPSSSTGPSGASHPGRLHRHEPSRREPGRAVDVG